ncbi:hypothetical protein PHMEG_00032915, partial [Phytophthora megakarya]
MDLCIVTWGYFAFLEMLKDRDDLFWYGGTPGKGSADAHNLTNSSPMENLVKLGNTTKNDRTTLSNTPWIQPTLTTTVTTIISDQGLARVCKDIMSAASQTVPPEWVGPKDEDPWKSLINSNRIKTVQDALYVKIKSGKFKPPTVPLVTEKEKDHSDFSDFEDDDGV